MTFPDRAGRGLVVLAGPPRLNAAPTFNGTVWATAYAGTTLYVGGAFGTVNGARRDSIARIDAGTGAVHPFRHSMTGMPYAMAVGGGRLYVGGSISALDGTARGGLAALSLSSGAVDNGWKVTADDTLESVVVSGSRTYLAAGVRVRRVGPVDPDHGRDPQAVAVLTRTVYIGGHFDNVCRSARTGDKGTCLDGETRRVKLAAAAEGGGALLSWVADGNGSSGVHGMAASAKLKKVVAGGAFTQINGRSRARLAQFG